MGAARWDDDPVSASLNLTACHYQHIERLFPVGPVIQSPALIAHLNSLAAAHAPGALTLNTIDRPASLCIGIEGQRVNRKTKGCLKDLYESFRKFVEKELGLGKVCAPRPAAPALPPGAVAVGTWLALGENVPTCAPWPANGAGGNNVGAAAAGSYEHFEETLFGTQDALQAVDNGPANWAHANGLSVNPVVNMLVVTRMPAAATAGSQHAAVIGASPNGRPGHGNTNRAQNAATARNEKPLFMGLLHLDSNLDSTVNLPSRMNSLLTNAIVKTDGRPIAGVGNASAPPSPGTFGDVTMGCLEEFGIEGILHFDAETIYATPANAFPTHPALPPDCCSHSICGQDILGPERCLLWELGRGFPVHTRRGKTTCWRSLFPLRVVQPLSGRHLWVCGARHCQGCSHARTHRQGMPKKETDVVPAAMAQALRNYAGDIHTAAHGGPDLFRAALKSGSHPSKCGLCIPILSNRIGGDSAITIARRAVKCWSLRARLL